MFFNESFDFWNKTKNIEKLPIIQWIIFFISFQNNYNIINYFIEITSKKFRWNFINFIFILVFLFIDQRYSNKIDCWWMNEKKLNEKRMMMKTIRIINKNEFIDSNDINKNKLNRWMKGNEWLKWFGDWRIQTDW